MFNSQENITAFLYAAMRGSHQGRFKFNHVAYQVALYNSQ